MRPEVKTEIDRLPPHSVETEAAFLGCILLDPVAGVSDAISRGVDSEWFYDLRHRTVFRTLVEMVDNSEKVDLVTLQQRLKDRGELEAIGGVSFLAGLLDASPSAVNLSYYGDILQEKALSRRLIATCTEIVQDAYDNQSDVGRVIDTAESAILAVRRDNSGSEAKSIRDILLGIIDTIQARKEGKTGIPTGLADIDRMTNGGIRDREFWVVAARPSCGKTSLLMNIADNAAARFRAEWEATAKPGAPYDGACVAVFSLEMTAEDLGERQLAGRSRVNTRTPAPLTGQEEIKLAEAAKAMAKLPIIIDDTAGLTISALRARARRLVQRRNVKLIFVDYLQLLASEMGARGDRRVEVDSISRGLKALAKELVPVVAAAQLNREFEKEGKARKPRMADLRESGSIEQDADVIGFLYNDPEQDIEELSPLDPRVVLFRIGKQRNGPRDIDIPLTFFPAITKFESCARISAFAP